MSDTPVWDALNGDDVMAKWRSGWTKARYRARVILSSLEREAHAALGEYDDDYEDDEVRPS